MKNKFSYSKTFWKALMAALAAYLITEINTMVATGTFPMTVEDWKRRGLALGVALVAGAAKVIHNVMKTTKMPGNPLRTKPSTPDLYRVLIIGGLAATFLGGCGTLPGGALAGKTSYNVEFSDTTEGQDTRYKMNIKAPAGADLASITGMTYDWRPDNSGTITVSQDQTTDTTVQAATLAEVNAQSMAAMANLLQMLVPVLSQAVDAKVEEGRIRAGVADRALDKLPPLRLNGAEP